jgi:hypothetical protein
MCKSFGPKAFFKLAYLCCSYELNSLEIPLSAASSVRKATLYESQLPFIELVTPSFELKLFQSPHCKNFWRFFRSTGLLTRTQILPAGLQGVTCERLGSQCGLSRSRNMHY